MKPSNISTGNPSPPPLNEEETSASMGTSSTFPVAHVRQSSELMGVPASSQLLSASKKSLKKTGGALSQEVGLGLPSQKQLFVLSKSLKRKGEPSANEASLSKIKVRDVPVIDLSFKPGETQKETLPQLKMAPEPPVPSFEMKKIYVQWIKFLHVRKFSCLEMSKLFGYRKGTISNKLISNRYDDSEAEDIMKLDIKDILENADAFQKYNLGKLPDYIMGCIKEIEMRNKKKKDGSINSLCEILPIINEQRLEGLSHEEIRLKLGLKKAEYSKIIVASYKDDPTFKDNDEINQDDQGNKKGELPCNTPLTPQIGGAASSHGSHVVQENMHLNESASTSAVSSLRFPLPSTDNKGSALKSKSLKYKEKSIIAPIEDGEVTGHEPRRQEPPVSASMLCQPGETKNLPVMQGAAMVLDPAHPVGGFKVYLRWMLFLKSRGYSGREQAEIFSCTPETISGLTKKHLLTEEERSSFTSVTLGEQSMSDDAFKNLKLDDLNQTIWDKILKLDKAKKEKKKTKKDKQEVIITRIRDALVNGQSSFETINAMKMSRTKYYKFRSGIFKNNPTLECKENSQLKMKKEMSKKSKSASKFSAHQRGASSSRPRLVFKKNRPVEKNSSDNLALHSPQGVILPRSDGVQATVNQVSVIVNARSLVDPSVELRNALEAQSKEALRVSSLPPKKRPRKNLEDQ